ncbi:hypothetical protein [Geoglobus acetivorans]|uniref:Uncharacterized protein n=1 Tax=Geoglobus acetivorans TaxID=565033 RepID=A0ABZ3H436_GEOAI|nr:hypothetical protein [Geoglobus acetivorans]
MPFAPVLKNGLAVIKVEAREDILEKLKQLKLIEERDGEYYLRKISKYRSKILNLLETENLMLTITIRDGFIVYCFEDDVEAFMADVDRLLEEVEAIS